MQVRMNQRQRRGRLGIFAGAVFAAGLCVALLPTMAFANEPATSTPAIDGLGIEQGGSDNVMGASVPARAVSAQDSAADAVSVASEDDGERPAGDAASGESGASSVDEDDAPAVTEGLVGVNGRFKYQNSDGTFLTKAWKTIGSDRYYFGGDGYAVRYSQTIDGKLYYFDASGVMHTGWVTWNSDGKRSYFAPSKNGAAAKGWWTIGGKRYYFKADTLRTLRGKWKIDGKTYYFNKDGSARVGWLQWSSDKTWSYFNSKGRMCLGHWTIDGYRYNFGTSGKVKKRVITARVRMTDKIRNYGSSSSWLIAVNKSTHKVGVYKGGRGSWSLKYYWSCVTGASGSPTIEGSFLTPGYKKMSLSTDSRARYCTQIRGGYFFHTILASNSELGNSLSHGCIRLATSNAKWIYNNIPSGTRVVIY